MPNIIVLRGCLVVTSAVAILAMPRLGLTGQGTTGPCQDKVRITAFTIEDSTADSVWTLAVTMKNLCGGTNVASVLAVPWRITMRDSLIGWGVLPIPPGGTGVGKATWRKSPGTFQFDAAADSNNTLNEPASARVNNRSARPLEVRIPAR